jgi:hypothetical protein
MHTNPIPEELYVIEVDGIRTSEHRIFIEALKRGLEVKRQYPRSDVKLRDAHHTPQHEARSSATCYDPEGLEWQDRGEENYAGSVLAVRRNQRACVPGVLSPRRDDELKEETSDGPL